MSFLIRAFFYSMDCAYVILGIERDATATEIKNVYKELRIINHPDKGGTEEQVSN